MMKNRSAAILAALLLFPAAAFGQGAVLQSGLVVPGHTAAWLANGIIADSGYPSLTLNSPVSGQAVVWNGVTAIGAAGTASTPNPTYPLTALPVVAAGQPVCIYDAPSTGANHSLCLGTVGGVATITSAANNGASTGAFTIVNNGAVITLPTTTGGLVGSITGGTGITVGGTSTAPVVSINASQMPTVFDSAFGSTPGDVLWRSPSGWAALGPGANGTCLTYNTSGPSVSWGSCAGTGGTGTVTSIATSGLVSGGTITTTGTISLAAIADGTLVGNVSGGSAVPTANTVTSVLDSALGNTRGSVAERGGSGWTALAPGAANTVFIGNGAGADPSYSALSDLIDNAIGSTRGSLLMRGASGWTLLAPGTSGYAVVSNGAGADPTYQVVTAGLTQPTQTVLATAGSGTFTTPGGAVGLHIRMVGAGGAGGGGGNGGGGGSSTFGSYTAGGGGGGQNSGSVCTAGVGAGGAVNLTGGQGSRNDDGIGGASAFGGGGGRGASGVAPGSGGGVKPSTGASAGCAAGYVEAWINSPSATYSYAVGAGGTPNSGAGAGATGLIIIEVRYY